MVTNIKQKVIFVVQFAEVCILLQRLLVLKKKYDDLNMECFLYLA